MTSRSGNDAGEPPIDRDALRAQLAEMEPREKKIVGGMPSFSVARRAPSPRCSR